MKGSKAFRCLWRGCSEDTFQVCPVTGKGQQPQVPEENFELDVRKVLHHRSDEVPEQVPGAAWTVSKLSG